MRHRLLSGLGRQVVRCGRNRTAPMASTDDLHRWACQPQNPALRGCAQGHANAAFCREGRTRETVAGAMADLDDLLQSRSKTTLGPRGPAGPRRLMGVRRHGCAGWARAPTLGWGQGWRRRVRQSFAGHEMWTAPENGRRGVWRSGFSLVDHGEHAGCWSAKRERVPRPASAWRLCQAGRAEQGTRRFRRAWTIA